MRKRTIWILAVFILFSRLVPVQANSAPVYWEVSPSSSVMVVEVDSPISVLKEIQTFDFQEKLDDEFSKKAKVTAQYTMKNTEDQEVLSTMVFPYFGRFMGNEHKGEVLLDGEEVLCTAYYGEVIRKDGSERERFSLQEVLATIEKEDYLPRNFNLEKKGTLYQVRFKSLDREEFTGRASFSLKNGEKALAKNLNSYGFSDWNHYEIGTFVQNEDTMEIFLLGEEIELKTTADLFGETSLTEGVDYDVVVTKTALSFQEYYGKVLEESDYLGNTKLSTREEHNFILKEMDKAFDRESLLTEDHIAGFLQEERLIFLYYEVPFKSLEEKTVTIIYEAEGSMDRRESKDPTYTFEYLLSPAGYFKDFKNLELQILPSKEYPYVISSSVELERDETGNYVGIFKMLPEEDLRFTLYNEEEITIINRVEGYISNNYYGVIFMGGLIILSALLIVLIMGIRRNIRTRRNHLD